MRACINVYDMDNDKIAIIQYGTTAQVHCEFLDNAPELGTIISCMSQKGGGTNIMQALESAEYLFDNYAQSSHRGVIILTGGDLSSGKRKCIRMREKGKY